MSTPPRPDLIAKTSYGFISSRVLFSAIEFGLFSELAKGPLNAGEIQQRCRLHERGVRDFLDTLVTLGMLDRRGDSYSNTVETDFYLDSAKSTYIGNYVEISSLREYQLFEHLSEALTTGAPQNEIKSNQEDWVDALYATPERLRFFLRGMTGHSLPSAMAIAQKFPWTKYKTFADIGTAEGCLPVRVAMAHPHLTGEGFDLPAVRAFFEEYIASFRLQDRVRFHVGDFFKDPLPSADVLTMGMILHDWNLEMKMTLLQKALEALPRGGSLIVYDHVIDDERRENLNGLLMSLLMLVETQGGFDYTGADCCGWMRKAGFRETYVEELNGIESMVVGIK
ncbi:MAG: methyltransferase [Acidobacteria bacterium]|nr:methyltransferase [Acidobacteriota bacterium]